jgi:hypothetical protein
MLAGRFFSNSTPDINQYELLFAQSDELASTASQSTMQPGRASKKRYKPPRIPVSIKSANTIVERTKYQKQFFCENGSPCTGYNVISDKGKPGKTYLAQGSIVSTKRVAVKQLTVARRSLTTSLRRTSHGKVVNLLAAFVDGNVVSLAYEVMDITLGELRRQTELEEKYISYISREAGVIVCIVCYLL